jgi:hypothetical protein
LTWASNPAYQFEAKVTQKLRFITLKREDKALTHKTFFLFLANCFDKVGRLSNNFSRQKLGTILKGKNSWFRNYLLAEGCRQLNFLKSRTVHIYPMASYHSNLFYE